MLTLKNENTKGKEVITFFAGDDGLFMRLTNIPKNDYIDVDGDPAPMQTATIQLTNAQLDKLRAYLAGEEF